MESSSIIKNEKEDVKNEEKEDIEYFDSVGLKSTLYNDFVGRYFSKYYINKGEPNEQYIFIHSNGIIMCGIGKNNSILKENIKNIVYLREVGKITGKKKNGAHFLCPNEYLMNVNYIDQSSKEEKVFKYCPKVKGKLLEINERILKNTEILINKPESDGFICLVMMKPEQLQKFKETLGEPENII